MAAIRYELESKFGSTYGEDEARALIDVLGNQAPTSGNACISFEKEFAAYCGTEYARACSNGTAALFLSLLGLGVGKGDRVLTTPLTCLLTCSESVLQFAVALDLIKKGLAFGCTGSHNTIRFQLKAIA